MQITKLLNKAEALELWSMEKRNREYAAWQYENCTD